MVVLRVWIACSGSSFAVTDQLDQRQISDRVTEAQPDAIPNHLSCAKAPAAPSARRLADLQEMLKWLETLAV